MTKHKEKYKLYSEKVKNLNQEIEIDNILGITEKLIKHKISCFKYNYALE